MPLDATLGNVIPFERETVTQLLSELDDDRLMVMIGAEDREACPAEGLSALSSEPTDRSVLSRSLSWRASAPNLGHQAARKGGRAPL